jgi:GNAT superfamily N-acetyltransferase
VSGWTLRFGRGGDVAAALEIERAADSRFAPGLLPSHELTDAAAFEDGLFVVAERGHRMVGFALAREYGETMHLEQVSVHPDEGRRGVGSALLAAVIDDAEARGCDSVTLTTFRSVPWNAPYYARRGFVEPAVVPEHVAEMLADEARLGFDPADRVGMVLSLGSARD